ncbi:hypothetical protein NBRC116601_12520 [Cognatishimia sp. WU-CL00825]|uniref:DUF2937 family protein n=1 Tax=Cognatishimia sp. WU-CL00825 TaxID=3127658 RepID=UPI00310281AA
MITRALVLMTGLSGAAGLSQFPEFSQQYAQRLGGAVDELQSFVADFDRDANDLGLSRADALGQLSQGGDISAARAETMSATIDRYERLKQAMRDLSDAGPFTRAYHMGQFNDPAIQRAAWRAFRPALPLTFEGLIFAAVGFFAGILGCWANFAALRNVFRRRKGADQSA